MHVVISGNTGCGKTTLAKELGARLKLPVISSGDIARELAKTDRATELALQFGNLAPEQAMRAEIRVRIENADITQGGWILDGFPRSIEQLACLLQWSAAMPCFIHIELDEWSCIRRIVDRNRENDHPDAIGKRLEGYRIQTSLMVTLLTYGGVLMRIDGNMETRQQADCVLLHLGKLAR